MKSNPFWGGMPRPTRARDYSDANRIEDALNRSGWTLRPNVDLRKIREGLGLSLQYVSGLAGMTDMTLLRCEDRMDDAEMVEEVMAVLALYMATRWGADILNLTEANLSESEAMS
ncbi:hypothetical protein ACIP5T_17205 [Microbacterium sp. NPDC088619]|uniref:hypothetical protein n=1 Tax=Microbacterium sp. NPDC088619 TaxID=3364196 RepID=UPI0037FC7A84